jgi:fucose 4-O-acetylase-like acetyltransferase
MEDRTPAPLREDLLTHHLNEVRQAERVAYEEGVKKGRNTLFWIAALLVVSQILISYARDQLSLQFLGIILCLGTFFAVLGFYTHKRPFTALLTGTLVYILIWIVDLACGYARGSVDVTTGLSGAVVRVAFTLFLVRALPDARRLEHLKRDDYQPSK